ncbi:Diphosphoinositol polyphosphate phosphohydrolase 2 [Goodea atripinnis]|uniref:Diphosphoinositol polyphosphate phosphohydrolase 2 n=1 Tax=Goodea atripinnis TaxID=208336 RepID=A0ABV0NUP0_9TELE
MFLFTAGSVGQQQSAPRTVLVFAFSLPTYACPLSPSAGRKREWFTVEEAIKVLQSHKPVHAEYLRRLQLSCSPTNGNSILPSPPPNDNYPHYSMTTDAPSTGSVLGSSCR